MFGFNDTISKLLVNIGGQILSAHKSKVGKAFFKLALDNMLEEYENFYED